MNPNNVHKKRHLSGLGLKVPKVKFYYYLEIVKYADVVNMWSFIFLKQILAGTIREKVTENLTTNTDLYRKFWIKLIRILGSTKLFFAKTCSILNSYFFGVGQGSAIMIISGTGTGILDLFSKSGIRDWDFGFIFWIWDLWLRFGIWFFEQITEIIFVWM